MWDVAVDYQAERRVLARTSRAKAHYVHGRIIKCTCGACAPTFVSSPSSASAPAQASTTTKPCSQTPTVAKLNSTGNSLRISRKCPSMLQCALGRLERSPERKRPRLCYEYPSATISHTTPSCSPLAVQAARPNPLPPLFDPFSLHPRSPASRLYDYSLERFICQ